METKELIKKSIEMAMKDEEFKEKTKDIKTKIAIRFKDTEEDGFTFITSKGILGFQDGIAPDAEFQFDCKEQDFHDLVGGKIPLLIAFVKMKLTKGSMAEIKKISPSLTAVIKYGKQIEGKDTEI